MQSRHLVALTEFPYGYGQVKLKAGEEFTALSDNDAELLILSGQAKVRDGLPLKKKYKTRELRADSE